jgi:NDP-sugar pyrophosphorylase family protein
MSFEKSIREDLSDIPVLFFLGGEGTRMGDLAYKHILPSKQWLPIGFDENNEPIPLFWRNFEILFELGFREFYILVSKDSEKVKKYFEKKIKEKDVNIWLLNKENLLKASKLEGANIYIFENNEKGVGNQILTLKGIIKSRPFLRVYGDEYFDGEKEKVKSEIRVFIEYALEKIEKEKAIEVFAFVDEKIVIGSIWKGLGIDENKQHGKIIETSKSNFIITSICLASPEFIDILQSEKKNSTPLDVASPEVVKRVIESQRVYGKVIDIRFFSNINSPEDYSKLVSYVNNEKNKNNKLLKLR